MGLLTRGSANRYGRLIAQLGDRNFLQVKIDPSWTWKGRDIIREQLVSLVRRPGMRLPEDTRTLDLVEEAIHHALEAGRPQDGRPETRSAEEKPVLPSLALEPEFDYAGLEERFRGSEDDIKERQRIYAFDR